MKKYGIIGYPLAHSFSRVFFTEKFSKEQIDAQYVNFEFEDIADFVQVIKENTDLCGLNVTKPHKIAVMPFLDEIDEDAASVGAVNVIAFRKTADGKTRLKGYNSDVYGFRESIKPLLNSSHKKALVLGTGGAAQAVMYGLKQLGVEALFVSRRKSGDVLTYDEIDERLLSTYTVVVNATPLGMFPAIDDCPAIPYSLLTPNHVLFDLIYNPEETVFLRKGKEAGAVVKNGLDMLEIQAHKAWDYWNREE